MIERSALPKRVLFPSEVQINKIQADGSLAPFPFSRLTEEGTSDAAIEYLTPLAVRAYKSGKQNGKGAIILFDGKGAYIRTLNIRQTLTIGSTLLGGFNLLEQVIERSRHARAKEFVLVEVSSADGSVNAFVVQMDRWLEDIVSQEEEKERKRKEKLANGTH